MYTIIYDCVHCNQWQINIVEKNVQNTAANRLFMPKLFVTDLVNNRSETTTEGLPLSNIVRGCGQLLLSMMSNSNRLYVSSLNTLAESQLFSCGLTSLGKSECHLSQIWSPKCVPSLVGNIYLPAKKTRPAWSEPIQATASLSSPYFSSSVGVKAPLDSADPTPITYSQYNKDLIYTNRWAKLLMLSPLAI